MAKVLDKNKTWVPFLGDRLSYIGGLDPLGLQNTSNATFAMLLPGLNNLTQHIRYYSFYCWVLDEYSKRSGSTDPREQRRFIRKAEFMMALVAQFHSHRVTGIMGSDFAFAYVDKQEVHDLKEATENENGSTESTYWKYSNGAFGQYYVGSLQTIGVVTENETGTLYIRTPENEDFVSGEVLARNFDQNLSPKKKELFFHCLDREEISNEQLKQLLPDFNIPDIPDSEERNNLLSLLMQKDLPLDISEIPSFHRRNSMILALNFFDKQQEKATDRDFAIRAYQEKGRVNHEKDTTFYGWYYYQFNEYWQYANTAILNGCLGYLLDEHGSDWFPIPNLINEITSKTIAFFKEQNLCNSSEEKVQDVLQNLIEQGNINEENHFETLKDTASIERIATAFLQIFTLYHNNEEEIIHLNEYGKRNELERDGAPADFFKNVFRKQQKISLYKFIKDFIYKRILYRHQYVALRKIGGGNRSTQKFIMDENHIRYIDNFNPAYTGPRLGSLFSFLTELHLIDEEQNLTQKGNLLKNENLES